MNDEPRNIMVQFTASEAQAIYRAVIPMPRNEPLIIGVEKIRKALAVESEDIPTVCSDAMAAMEEVQAMFAGGVKDALDEIRAT